ncbi:MAG TPA: hypothetical protein VNU26_18875, partial [Mycobacteriales bacterium]|nr:hypothetical protein [Mycobacteriales bacterium]
ARLAEERDAHRDVLATPPESEAPDAHLPHPARPREASDDRRSRLLRVWAAVSTPVLILGIGVLLAWPTPQFLLGFASFLAVFAVVEAALRRRMLLLLTVLGVVVLTVAVVAGVYLLISVSWTLVLAVLLGVGAVGLLAVNLRELLRA